MTRWFWKRWAMAVLVGTAVAAGYGAFARADDTGPPTGQKAGDKITMRFEGQPERTVTVLKFTRKPDGSTETEVKDAKTGETFTLIDPPAGKYTVPAAPAPQKNAKPGNTAAKPSHTQPVSAIRDLFPSRSKGRTEETISPPAPPESPKEKRGFLGRMFGRDQTDPTPPAPPAGAMTPDDGGRKPGILGRLFGKKPPATAAGAAMPAEMRSPSGPALFPGSSPVTPYPGAASAEPPRVAPVRPYTPPTAPARVDPVAPPTPVVPAPIPTPPSSPGAIPIPTPLPMTRPAPIPVPTPLPSIPTIPGGTSRSRTPAFMPTGVVQVGAVTKRATPAGYTVLQGPMADDIRPYATALRDALAPSARITAAKALAEGRHGSTDAVKRLLFHATRTDPCPAVKAACIEHLCKLGYYEPAFLKHLKAACDDPAEDVQTAAKAALAKMSPR